MGVINWLAVGLSALLAAALWLARTRSRQWGNSPSHHAHQHTFNSLQANIGRALWHTDKRVARAAHHLSMRSQLWARLGQL